jgi:hypothetical protein
VKTPYDTALRARQREVDDLRTTIGGAARKVAEAEALAQALSETVAHEKRIAAGDLVFSPVAYLARTRAEASQLHETRRTVTAELDALRQRAIESYGSLRALEGAAQQFRESAERDAATAEQASVDDFAGARFARALHQVRQARAQSQDVR